MRLRWQRRIRKHLRRMRGQERRLAQIIAKVERQGLAFVKTLWTVMLDPARYHSDRGAIGRLLLVAGDDRAVQALLKLFFEQTGKAELFAPALTLEYLNDRRAVPALIRA